MTSCSFKASSRNLLSSSSSSSAILMALSRRLSNQCLNSAYLSRPASFNFGSILSSPIRPLTLSLKSISPDLNLSTSMSGTISLIQSVSGRFRFHSSYWRAIEAPPPMAPPSSKYLIFRTLRIAAGTQPILRELLKFVPRVFLTRKDLSIINLAGDNCEYSLM